MTPERALAQLERLGSADAIAQRLTDIGCTGTSYEGSCPVARFVTVESGEPVEIGDHCSLLLADDGDDYISLGPNVERFVWRFDNGKYPALQGDPDGNAMTLFWGSR